MFAVGRRKHNHRSGTPATTALERAGIDFSLHPYEHGRSAARSYGHEAAQALGIPAERIFKTLLAEVDGSLVVAVVPVDCSLDLKALAAATEGKRAAMAPAADAERATGYVIGGISPLGQKRRLPTVVDRSALDFDTVYVSAGKRGLQVELAPADLIRLTGSRTAAIGRPD